MIKLIAVLPQHDRYAVPGSPYVALVNLPPTTLPVWTDTSERCLRQLI